MLINILIYISVVTLWCLGGQINKSYRRFVLPVLASLLAYLKNKSKKYLAIAPFLAVILSIGYGENSVFMKIFKVEWAVRLAYSILLCLPFMLLVYKPILWLACMVTIIAFQLRLGGIKIGKYDLLFEDVARASAVSLFFIL